MIIVSSHVSVHFQPLKMVMMHRTTDCLCKEKDVDGDAKFMCVHVSLYLWEEHVEVSLYYAYNSFPYT